MSSLDDLLSQGYTIEQPTGGDHVDSLLKQGYTIESAPEETAPPLLDRLGSDIASGFGDFFQGNVRALKKGVDAVAGGALDNMPEMAGQFIPADLFNPAAKWIASQAQEPLQDFSNRGDFVQNATKLDNPTYLDKLVESTAGTVPYLAMSPALGAADAGVVQASNKYDELKARGATDQQAMRGALASGTGEGLLMSLPLMKAAKEGISPLRKALETSLAMSGQAAGSPFVEAGADYIGGQEMPTAEQLGGQIREGVKVAAGTGLLLGGAGAAHDMLSRGGPEVSHHEINQIVNDLAIDEAPPPEPPADLPPPTEPVRQEIPDKTYEPPPVIEGQPQEQLPIVESQPPQEPSGIVPGDSYNARTPEEQAQAQQTQMEVDYGVSTQPVDLFTGEPVENPDAEIIAPFTDKGTVRKALPEDLQKAIDDVFAQEQERKTLEAQKRDYQNRTLPVPVERSPVIKPQPGAEFPRIMDQVREGLGTKDQNAPFMIEAQAKQIKANQEIPILKKGEPYSPVPILGPYDVSPKTMWEKLKSEQGMVVNPFRSNEEARLTPEILDEANKKFEDRSQSDKFFRPEGVKGAFGLGVIRRAFTEPFTKAKYFPEVAPGVEAKYEKIRKGHAYADKLSDAVRPYLNIKDKTKIHDLMNKMMAAQMELEGSGKTLASPSDEYLAKKGLNPEEVAGFRSWEKVQKTLVPNMLRKGFRATAEMLSGEDKATFLKASEEYLHSLQNRFYIPRTRAQGNYFVTGYTPTGDVNFFSFFPTRKAAVSQYAELRRAGAEGANLRLGEIPTEVRGAFDVLPPDVAMRISKFDPDVVNAAQATKGNLLAEKNALLRKETTSDVEKLQVLSRLKDINEKLDNIDNSSLPVAGFRAHLINSKNIAGFDPDIQRSIVEYLYGAANYTSGLEAKPVYKDVLNNLDPEKQGDLRKWFKEYISPRSNNNDKLIQKAMFVTNLWNLAGVPMSAFANLTTVPRLGWALAHDHLRSAGETIGVINRATALTTKYTLDQIAQAGGMGGSFARAHPRESAIIELAKRRGAIDADNVKNMLAIRDNAQLRNSAEKVGMFFFGAAENFNRVWGTLAGYDIAKSKGLKGKDAFQFAEKFNNDMNYVQNESNRPPIASFQLGGHDVGKLAMMYRLWPYRYIRFLRNVGGGAAVGSLMATLAIAGVRGLPGGQDMDNLLKAGGVDYSLFLRKLMGNNEFSDALIYGGTFPMGLNLSGVAGTGEYMPDVTDSAAVAGMKFLAGPSSSLVTNALKAKEIYSKYDRPEIALENLAPRFARGTMKALRWGSQGKLDSYTGGAIVDRPPSMGEAIQLAAGSSPPSVTKSYEKQAAIRTIESQFKDDSNMAFRFAQARVNNDVDGMRAVIEESKRKGIPINPGAVLDAVLRIKNADIWTLKKAPTVSRPTVLETQKLYSGE